MGVWGPGFRPLMLDHAAIKADMQRAALPWYTAHVRIIDPQLALAGVYDPMTDTTVGGPVGPDEGLVWDSGPAGALIAPQQPRTERGNKIEAEAISTIQVQTSLPPDIHLRAGLRLKVIDGGSFPQLEDHEWAVQEGIGSSLQWGAIITCTAAG